MITTLSTMWCKLSSNKHIQKRAHPGANESQQQSPIGRVSKLGKMPINEFYRKYIHDGKVSSRPDIATFFIYYLEKIKENEEVTSTDVKDCFNKVQYPGWNKINIGDVLNKAKKKAFLNSVGNQWSLTITGEDFVLNNLSE